MVVNTFADILLHCLNYVLAVLTVSLVSSSFSYTEYTVTQGTHGTGKTGKTGTMTKKIPCQGKHREFGNFAKTQGNLFGQVVNSLILKVKDIAIFAAKISNFFPKRDRSGKSVLCI